MKFILLIVVPIVVAIAVGFTTNSWIWAIVSFIGSMFAANWIGVALFGHPTAKQERHWRSGQFEDLSPNEISDEFKQIKSRVTGPPSAVLDKVVVIADFKFSSPFVIRSFTHVNGVYVQRSQTVDGFTAYAAGSDMFEHDLKFLRNISGEINTVKYVPGNWEKVLDRLFSKVQKLKSAVKENDKDTFIALLQEGQNIANVDNFTRLAEAGFDELIGQ